MGCQLFLSSAFVIIISLISPNISAVSRLRKHTISDGSNGGLSPYDGIPHKIRLESHKKSQNNDEDAGDDDDKPGCLLESETLFEDKCAQGDGENLRGGVGNGSVTQRDDAKCYQRGYCRGQQYDIGCDNAAVKVLPEKTLVLSGGGVF